MPGVVIVRVDGALTVQVKVCAGRWFCPSTRIKRDGHRAPTAVGVPDIVPVVASGMVMPSGRPVALQV